MTTLDKVRIAPRLVRVVVPAVTAVRKAAPIMDDIFSQEKTKEGTVINGAAWDFQIDALRARGYTVDIVPAP